MSARDPNPDVNLGMLLGVLVVIMVIAALILLGGRPVLI